MPARPDRQRLGSGFCTSARGFGTRFLQTFPRGHALALPFGPCGQVPEGLSPSSRQSCQAHTKWADRGKLGRPRATRPRLHLAGASRRSGNSAVRENLRAATRSAAREAQCTCGFSTNSSDTNDWPPRVNRTITIDWNSLPMSQLASSPS